MYKDPKASASTFAFRPKLAKVTSVSRHALTAFWKKEDGSATILTLFILMFMLVMAGLGVDTMRHEMERTHLQATLDASVLAGAGSPTEKTEAQIRGIVEDYFAKNGMSEYLNEIKDEDITSTLNSTKVSATADMQIDTYLMKLSGVDTLDAAAAATAEITIPKLEISLVLDVSGSMQGSKLTAVQSAAKEFVTAILQNSDPGNAVISVVPFSWGVTPNDSIYEALTVNETHDHSTCLRFSSSDFGSTAINPGAAYDQQVYTSWRDELFDGDGGVVTEGSSWAYNRSCFTDPYFRILPYSISESQLHTKIDSLQAAGSTSQHLGMKWGAALLDPAFSSVLSAMQTPQVDVDPATGTTVTSYEVNPSLSNIPAAYSEPDTQKVIVMMGDGKNDISMFFADTSSYRGLDSDLYEVFTTTTEFDYGVSIYDPSVRYYDSWAESYCSNSWFDCYYTDAAVDSHFLFSPTYNDYYNIDDNEFLSAAEFATLTTGLTELRQGVDVIPAAPTDTVVRYRWENAWALMSPRYYGEKTGDWTPHNEYWNNRQTTDVKDTRMDSICDAVKGHNNIVIYTIGFEITAGGHAETQLKQCASGYDAVTGTNFYFPSDKASISETFAAIASNVQNLRLTQ
ncbi:MAG: VWA domain-containing protein [Pseudomonadota bacterium]